MRSRRKLLSAFAMLAVFIGGTPPVKAAGEHDCCERSILKLAAERAAGQPVRSVGAGDLADAGCHMDHTGIRGYVDLVVPPPTLQAKQVLPQFFCCLAQARPSATTAATGPPIYIVQLSLLV